LQYKEAKKRLESLQSELDGIKRMIQKNLIAKENTLDLITADDDAGSNEQQKEKVTIKVFSETAADDDDEKATMPQKNNSSQFLSPNSLFGDDLQQQLHVSQQNEKEEE
jgi:hypothetical protein